MKPGVPVVNQQDAILRSPAWRRTPGRTRHLPQDQRRTSSEAPPDPCSTPSSRRPPGRQKRYRHIRGTVESEVERPRVPPDARLHPARSAQPHSFGHFEQICLLGMTAAPPKSDRTAADPLNSFPPADVSSPPHTQRRQGNPGPPSQRQIPRPQTFSNRG